MKHRHAELIKAWAEGAEIQVYKPHWDEWHDCNTPIWDSDEYRIKPKKPEIKIDSRLVYLNLRFTIERDGPMANIIDVEMVK